jgi:hypothetical protein
MGRVMIIGWTSKRNNGIWKRSVKGKRGKGAEEQGVKELF